MKQELEVPSEKQRRLTQDEKMLIVTELASGRFSQKSIAQRHDLSEQRISQIKQEHQTLFDSVRDAQLDDITADMIRQQEWRLTQYARDMEKLDSQWHSESVKARSQILKNVSDELGQGTPRAQITIRPVEHVIVDVDLADL